MMALNLGINDILGLNAMMNRLHIQKNTCVTQYWSLHVTTYYPHIQWLPRKLAIIIQSQ